MPLQRKENSFGSTANLVENGKFEEKKIWNINYQNILIYC